MLKLPPHDDGTDIIPSLHEDVVARALLHHPDHTEAAWQYITPELFNRAHNQYLIATQLDLRKRYGTAPTLDVFRHYIAKSLIVRH